jgi:hypothetical protein
MTGVDPQHPLAGINAKLDRAQEHLDAIDAAVDRFARDERNADPVFDNLDLAKEWQILRWQHVQPTPLVWGAMLGDYVHNVRGALDHLMWLLVLRNGGQPGNWTHFPISETEAQWRVNVVERDVGTHGNPPTEGITDEAFALVEEFQPFRRGAMLLPLLRISNTDKHRLLHAAQIYMESKARDLMIVPRGYYAISRVRFAPRPIMVENGAEIAKVKLRAIGDPPPDLKMGVEFKMMLHLDFRAEGKPVAQHRDLQPMLNLVREIIAAASDLSEISG